MNSTTLTAHPAADWYMGSLFTWHVDAAASGGTVALAETLVPAGAEPPLHVHAREDELFHVLEGEVTFQRGLERIEAGPGTAIMLPRGVQHGFALRTPVARMLVVTTPAGLEEAFRAFSEPAAEHALPPLPEGPPDPELMRAMEAEFVRHGVTFVGPPLRALL
jgi:quercetin dioxygenase-like cupin family protein